MTPEIDVKTLQAKLGQAEKPVIVDVRNPPEIQAAGALDGALLIPMNELPARVGELPKDREIVAVCARGARSFNVAHWLRAQGFNAVSLQGGMDLWRASGLPVKR